MSFYRVYSVAISHRCVVGNTRCSMIALASYSTEQVIALEKKVLGHSRHAQYQGCMYVSLPSDYHADRGWLITSLAGHLTALVVDFSVCMKCLPWTRGDNSGDAHWA